jgi:transcriptional regulator with XRE-family HTH domain
MKPARSLRVDTKVGPNLKRWRVAKGMSQGYLGNLIGVSFQQIQKYENGKNSIPTARLRSICRSLTITPDDLFGKVKDND